MRLIAITFDLDDTLLDFSTAQREGLALVREDIVRALGLAPEALPVAEMMALRDQVTADWEGPWNLPAIRLAGFQRILESLGCDDLALARQVTDHYGAYRNECIRPYPDAVPALARLAGRFRLGAVSNGSSSLAHAGLDGYLSFAVFADDTGIAKPDPRLFARALALAGCAPAEALHVGDSLHEDVAGALAAGMRAIWLNRARRPNDTAVRPEATIASLAELLR